MRTNIVLVTTLALSLSVNTGWAWLAGAAASSNYQPEYATWSSAELKRWLVDHNVPLPTHTKEPTRSELRYLVAENWHSASAWTYDQYNHAQQTFSDLRDTAFETWDESRLREFLLRQGIVAPKATKDQLVMMAKSHYKGYKDAAKSFADRASSTASQVTEGASKTAEAFTTRVSAAVAQAETDVARAIDRSKDYVYSSWDDSKLRAYLQSKGLLKSNAEKKRDELLAMMEEYYNKVSNPIWESWSDSYMVGVVARFGFCQILIASQHEWLVSHHIIKSDFEKNRDKLRAELEKYYYGPSDRVWSTWSDSEMRAWLIDHGVIKSDAQVTRDKMQKMLEYVPNTISVSFC